MKIFILPGLDGTAQLLSEIVELLGVKHEVTAVRYEPDLHRYLDLKPRIEALLPDEDYIIVAESFSGPLATMIAADDRSGLRGVVFVATFAQTPIRVPEILTYLVDIALVKSHLLAKLGQPLLIGRWATPEFAERFQKVMKGVPASTIGGRLREVLRINVTGQLSSLKVPSIYLSATNDRLIPSSMASEFNRRSNSVFEITGPHFLLQANPKEAAKHILDFAASFD